MSTSLDVTPCVSFLCSLSHYSPHLTLVSFKVGHPLLPETLLSYLFIYGCVGSCSGQALHSGVQALIVARGLQTPWIQELWCTSLFALQPVGSFQTRD